VCIQYMDAQTCIVHNFLNVQQIVVVKPLIFHLPQATVHGKYVCMSYRYKNVANNNSDWEY